MKLDMGKAWSDATALLGSNFGLVATIVGLYYFLPSFAFAILAPDIANPAPPEMRSGGDPTAAFQAAFAALQDQYSKAWPYLLAITIAGYIGSISVLALFTEQGNPTVGQALKTGLRGTPSYLATQLIFAVGVGAIVGLILGLTAAVVPIVALLLTPFILAFVIYASIKLILVPAIIGMEGQLHPIKIMKRSWALTKGNSLMIFIFIFVLVIVVGLVSLVATLVLGTLFAAMGEPVATIGNALVDSLSSAIVGGLLLTVLAAIHRQLTPEAEQAVIDTFE